MKNKFYINRVGYHASADKIAVCTVNGRFFNIIDAQSGASVYEGRLSDPIYDKESDDTVRIADFSDFNQHGRFYIKIGIRRSGSFEISDNVFDGVKTDVMNAIKMSRCGYDTLAHADEFGEELAPFLTGSAHPDVISHSGKRYDMSGGWHTMGGFDKDVPATCIVIAELLYSLTVFPASFDRARKKRLLDECRWGLDFLLKMQDSDGGVFSDIHAKTKFTNGSPEEDTDIRLIGEKSCLACLRFASVTALAARTFERSDKAYSHRLSSAAQMAWIYIVGTSEYKYYQGKYGSLDDDLDGLYALESDFMWTMCEMYSLTGGSEFANMIEQKYTSCLFGGFGDRFCGGYASLAYLLADKPKKDFIVSFIRMRVSFRADRLWIARCESGYRVSCSAGGGYIYGTNQRILSNIQQCQLAYLLTGDTRYLRTATENLGYIFGCNPIGSAFITANKDGFCRNPCHRLSSSVYEDICLPGLVVGGANILRTDPFSKWNIEKNTPPAKCYIDNKFSYATNEPSIHYSAPLIFITAFYDEIGRSVFNSLNR